ncbi:hypothetical protein BV20DRAFT_709305 [Pilatotrama ljubarskyi]|nr:hypothetical protein BV20DRAFT_709305 [Pilatotrama ljubarskyi]
MPPLMSFLLLLSTGAPVLRPPINAASPAHRRTTRRQLAVLCAPIREPCPALPPRRPVRPAIRAVASFLLQSLSLPCLLILREIREASSLADDNCVALFWPRLVFPPLRLQKRDAVALYGFLGVRGTRLSGGSRLAKGQKRGEYG